MTGRFGVDAIALVSMSAAIVPMTITLKPGKTAAEVMAPSAERISIRPYSPRTDRKAERLVPTSLPERAKPVGMAGGGVCQALNRHSPDKCRLKATLRLFVVIGKPGSPRTRLRRV
jgi:hypothetical protein